MKKLSVLFAGAVLLLSVEVLPASAAVVPQREYIEKYCAIAVSEMERTGVPASITLAQGILESNSGQSELAVNANNHFGIKCHNDWNGLTYRQDDETAQECFRAYASPEESFVAHSDFLKDRSRYAALFKLDAKDYKAWANGLSYCGYATDPMYPEKLVKIIEDYKLYEYDDGPVPVAADASEKNVQPEDSPVEKPETPSVKSRRYKISEIVIFTLGRPVYYVDGAKCFVAMPGETYESIAKSCNLFNSEIRKFNSVKKGEAPVPGDYVFVERRHKGKEK